MKPSQKNKPKIWRSVPLLASHSIQPDNKSDMQRKTYILKADGETSLVRLYLLLPVLPHAHHSHRQVVENHIHFIFIRDTALERLGLCLVQARNTTKHSTCFIVTKTSLQNRQFRKIVRAKEMHRNTSMAEAKCAWRWLRRSKRLCLGGWSRHLLRKGSFLFYHRATPLQGSPRS
jgi:hypothetical protein